MIQRQANVLILVALASASLLGLLVLECQADQGDQDDEVERAKKEWLADVDHRVSIGSFEGMRMVEIVSQLHKSAPKTVLQIMSIEERMELVRLLDLATVDKECDNDKLSSNFPVREHSLPNEWANLAGLRHYDNHFMLKQIEACVFKINNETVDAVASLSEAEKHEADLFASYAPKLLMGAFIDYKDTFESGKQELGEAIHQFLEATGAHLSKNEAKFDTVFDDKMSFCLGVEETTRKALNHYLDVRGIEERFTMFLEPGTRTWLRVALACRRLKEHQPILRSLVQAETKKVKRSPKPSRAKKVLNYLNAKKQSSE